MLILSRYCGKPPGDADLFVRRTLGKAPRLRLRRENMTYFLGDRFVSSYQFQRGRQLGGLSKVDEFVCKSQVSLTP